MYILNRTITEWVEEGKKIAVEQAGFRMGYSTTDHIFTLLSVIPKSVSKGKWKVYVPFIDYQKAFEKKNREYPWACLLAKVLSKKMLYITGSALCCLRANYIYTNFFECWTEVKQGCLLCPNLFCLFTSEVAE